MCFYNFKKFVFIFLFTLQLLNTLRIIIELKYSDKILRPFNILTLISEISFVLYYICVLIINYFLKDLRILLDVFYSI